MNEDYLIISFTSNRILVSWIQNHRFIWFSWNTELSALVFRKISSFKYIKLTNNFLYLKKRLSNRNNLINYSVNLMVIAMKISILIFVFDSLITVSIPSHKYRFEPVDNTTFHVLKRRHFYIFLLVQIPRYL